MRVWWRTPQSPPHHVVGDTLRGITTKEVGRMSGTSDIFEVCENNTNEPCFEKFGSISKMRCDSDYINFAIAENCPFRIFDQFGGANCFFYEDAPGCCSPEFCPLAEGGDVLNDPSGTR